MSHRPNIAIAMLAAAMGGLGGAAGNAAESVMEFKLSADRWTSQNAFYSVPRRSSGIALGRSGGNQRQRRKDQRRAHAAGCKRAFLR